MNRFYSVRAAALLALSVSVSANSQQRATDDVAIHNVSATQARSTRTIGEVLSMRAIANGHVLVNDAFNRQLLEFDNNLALVRVVLDSAAGAPNYYGPVAAPLIPFVGDSSYFVDGTSLSLLLLDEKGNVVRTVAAPTRNDFRVLAGTPSFTDLVGNVLYRTATIDPISNQTPKAETDGSTKTHRRLMDSASIVRANFETRKLDTVARTKQQNGTYGEGVRYIDGKISASIFVHPMDAIDEWAVLSDGSIALLRAHDYHVDIVHPNGASLSGPTLPYEWKRMDETDKQHLVDSVQRTIDAEMEQAVQSGRMESVLGVINRTAGRYSTSMSVLLGAAPAVRPSSTNSYDTVRPTPVKDPPLLRVVPATDIPDYEPPFRPGALRADLDGNLWILPTRAGSSSTNSLVYDVVNNTGKLVERVRLPVGRSVAGFGTHGLIYLTNSVGEHLWTLELVRVER